MSVIEEGVIAYLQNYAGLVSLVSTRIYGIRIPQAATMPCVVVNRISTPRITTHQTSGASGDLISPRFQFDAWATTQASAKAITDQLRAALNGHTGSTGGGAVSFTLRAVLASDETIEYDPDAELYRGRSDYIVWHEE